MNQDDAPIYTIGYGQRTFEEFAALLKRYGIKYLLDVRSSPYSKHQPEFSREALKSLLRKEGMTYGFFGDSLGGRPINSSCYVDGVVDYGICRTMPEFRHGISRLTEAIAQGHMLALMCSEAKPQDCHRSKMIGVDLDENGFYLAHIDEKGSLKSQIDVMSLLKANQIDIFGAPASKSLTSRKRYISPSDGDDAS